MAMEAKSGGLAVAVAVRRPLQPRDSNVAAAAAALAGKANKAKNKVRARLGAPPTASPPSVKSYAKAESRVEVKEVSLAEELEKARERRGRMRAARDLTERVLGEREEALRQEAREWERRADEQRRLVAELMRLLGMPEVYTPVESLRSKEESRRKEAIAFSDSRGSTSTASTLQEDVGVNSCDQTFEAPARTETTTATTETNC